MIQMALFLASQHYTLSTQIVRLADLCRVSAILKATYRLMLPKAHLVYQSRQEPYGISMICRRFWDVLGTFMLYSEACAPYTTAQRVP